MEVAECSALLYLKILIYVEVIFLVCWVENVAITLVFFCELAKPTKFRKFRTQTCNWACISCHANSKMIKSGCFYLIKQSCEIGQACGTHVVK